MSSGAVLPDRGARRHSRPWLVIVLCLSTFLIPPVVVAPGPLKSNGSPAQFLAYVAVVLVALGWMRGRQRRSAASSPGVIALLLYFAAQIVSYAAGHTHVLSADAQSSTTRTLLVLLADVGTALVVIEQVRTRRQRLEVLTALAVGLVFEAAVGLLASVHLAEARYLFKPPGFVINVTRVEAVRGGFTRVLSTSDSPIELAVLMGAGIPLLLHLAKYGSGRWTRGGAAIGTVLLVCALPVSVSRSGVIALVAGIVVYSLVTRVRAILTASFVITLFIVGYYAVAPRLLYSLYSSFAHASTDNSVTGRTDDYANVEKIFAAHPVFGLGLGTNPPSSTAFLDNQWLQQIVQSGAVGLLALLGVVLMIVAGVISAAREGTTRELRDEATALGATAAAVVSSSFTFDLLAFQQASFLLFIVFGLVWSAVGSRPATTRNDRSEFGVKSG